MNTLVVFDKDGKGLLKILLSTENIEGAKLAIEATHPGCTVMVMSPAWNHENGDATEYWLDGEEIKPRTEIQLRSDKGRLAANPAIVWVYTDQPAARDWMPRMVVDPGEVVTIGGHNYVCQQGGITRDDSPHPETGGYMQSIYEITPSAVWKITAGEASGQWLPTVLAEKGDEIALPELPGFKAVIEKPGVTNPNRPQFQGGEGDLVLDCDAATVTVSIDEEVTVSIGGVIEKVKDQFSVYRERPGQFSVVVDAVKYFSSPIYFTANTPEIPNARN